MNKFLAMLYGAVAYAIFFASFLYAIGFVADIVVPKTIDSGTSGALLPSLAIDLALLGLFAVQHSVMARPAFKAWWTRLVPPAVERSTYVLFASLALVLLFWQWRPLTQPIWTVTDANPAGALMAISALGWLTVLTSTFLINHFDLFGLRQVWLRLCGMEYTPLKFGTPVLYRFVRHPLYVGWLLVFWSAPVMTVAHMVFTVATTAYILLAIRWEERDLMKVHPEYKQYRQRVPMILPIRALGQTGEARPVATSAANKSAA